MNSIRVFPAFNQWLLFNKRLLIVNYGIRNFASAVNRQWNKDLNYTFREVGIPVPGGTLAGKLWEPKCLSSQVSTDIPPVICLHGWLDNAGSFDLVLPLMMSQPTRYFCLDLPGHGLTTYCPEWWYDIHIEGILSVKRVAKHFGWDKFSIFGHSSGGIIGFLYTAYFPDEVHRLVALENMSTLPIPFESNIDMLRSSINIVFEIEERMKTPKKLYKYEEILDKLYEGRQKTVSKDGCIALLKRGASEVQPGQYHFSYSLRTSIPGGEGRTSLQMNLRLAKQVSSPVCFIKAEPGNVYDTEDNTEKFLAIFRDKLENKFELHKIPGTHHFHLNDPQKVAPIALKFLTA